MLALPEHFALNAIIGLCIACAVCLGAYLIMEDTKEPQNIGGFKKQKRLYDIYGEFVIQRKIASIEAESDDIAVDEARAAAEKVALSLGVEQPEILWAEEIR